MGILLESSTYIENLLKKALIKENIEFVEQYRIETGGRFSEIKYVADFFIKNDNVKLIVECDGFTYHAGSEKRRKQKKRDKWLNLKGYRVLHLTTNQIKYRMPEIVSCIKSNLQSSELIELTNNNIKQKNNKKILYKESTNVVLFCYYIQKTNNVFFVYKYKELNRNVWSDERKRICRNTPEEMVVATAIYNAMLDLKRDVTLQVFFNGQLKNNDYEIIKKLRTQISNFPNGAVLLKNNKVNFEYCNIDAYLRNYAREDLKTIRELKSRCLQISNREEIPNDVLLIEYDSLYK